MEHRFACERRDEPLPVELDERHRPVEPSEDPDQVPIDQEVVVMDVDCPPWSWSEDKDFFVRLDQI